MPIFKFSMYLAAFVFCLPTFASPIATKPILIHAPDGRIAHLSFVEGKLLVSDNDSKSIYVYSVQDLKRQIPVAPSKIIDLEKEFLEFNRGPQKPSEEDASHNHRRAEPSAYHRALVSDSVTGWVSSCHAESKRILSFNISDLDRPDYFWFADLEKMAVFEGDMSCSSLSLDVTNSLWPHVWFGSPSQKRLYAIQKDGSVFERYDPVAGIFNLQVVGKNVFAVLTTTEYLSAMPFVLNKETGNSIAGDREGNSPRSGSRFKTGYHPSIFYDRETRSIYYFRPLERILHRFSADFPSENEAQFIPIETSWPIAMSRFGKCLVVLGTTAMKSPDDHRPSYPQWSVFSVSKKNELHELRTTDFVESPETLGALRQVVDESGNIYLSGTRGISQISGVFDGLSCK